MKSGFRKRNPVKTSPMKDGIGVFDQCVLATPSDGDLQAKSARGSAQFEIPKPLAIRLTAGVTMPLKYRWAYKGPKAPTSGFLLSGLWLVFARTVCTQLEGGDSCSKPSMRTVLENSARFLLSNSFLNLCPAQRSDVPPDTL